MPTTTTRKGLPVPLITDAAGTNYTVGPAGRTIITTGKVRDEIGAISTLLDGITEYNQAEAITGNWDLQAPITTQKGLGNLFTNNTGAQRVSGDVVVLDTANDSSIILATAANMTTGRVGVVAETINAGAVGRVVFLGFIRIKVAGGVTRNMYLTTQNGSVIAAGSALNGTAAFAFTVTNQDGSNTCLAYLHPGSSMETGGQITGQIGIGVAPTTNRQIFLGGVVTASGGVGSAIGIASTLTAGANNDVLIALQVNPTFADAGFTGVVHEAIRVNSGGINVQSGSVVLSAGSILANAGDGSLFKAATATNTGGDTLRVLPFDDTNLTTPQLSVQNAAGSARNWYVTKAGGMYVASNTSIGTIAPSPNTGLLLSGAITTSQAGQQAALNVITTLTAAADSDLLFGVVIQPAFSNNAHTGITMNALALSPNYSSISGSTLNAITISGNSQANATSVKTAVNVGVMTGANLNNYGVTIALPTGASGNNTALVVGTVPAAAFTGGVFAQSVDCVFGTSNIANGAVVGFLYIPQGGGGPTGVPTYAGNGWTPIRMSSADNKMYAYINGSWKASPAFA